MRWHWFMMGNQNIILIKGKKDDWYGVTVVNGWYGSIIDYTGLDMWVERGFFVDEEEKKGKGKKADSTFSLSKLWP